MDEHFNKSGELPGPLEDDRPSDMPATKFMFVAMVVVAAIGVIWLIYLRLQAR
jgi:hypothetical protein